MGFSLAIPKRLILLFLLSLSLAMVAPSVSAQMFFPMGGSGGEASRTTTTTPWWDVNKARQCGRLWCSDVFLRGSSQVTLTVGLIPGPEETPQTASNAVENRAKQVESIFDSIYLKLIGLKDVEIPHRSVQFLRSKVFDLTESSLTAYPSPLNLPQSPEKIAPTGEESAPPAPESNGGEQSFIERRTPTTSLRHAPQSAIAILSSPATASSDLPADEIHPLTPRVEVGIQNNQTVLFIPNQANLGLSQQTILTINEADEIINGRSINILAYEWRNRVQDSFDKALWGHELDRQHPWDRYLISGFFVLISLMVVIIMGFIRSFLRRRDRLLRQELKSLAQAITKDIEAGTAESLRIADQASQENQPEDQDENGQEHQQTAKKLDKRRAWFLPFRNNILPVNNLTERLNDAWQNIGDLANTNLRKQTLLKQRWNLAVLMSWVLLWLQVSSVFIVIAFVAYIFPGTRPYTLLFIGQAMYFPLLWIGITLIDKFSGIFVDGFLNNWAQEQQQYKGPSNRYTLRVMTYSPAIKGGISFLLTLLGILGTIWLFGINPLVLASFGGVAFVLAFLGRNVVEDMLNGTLILLTDRYAIGDVVQIGDVFGLVENMNIYITQLRGPEGRLSTIPNGQISVVQNLTKDWSRAEFIVEIDQSSDIEKALAVIKTVSEQMREDHLWADKILEPAAILGVDNIASKGIQLQVWIKTQAGQHWPVGREFRLRMKKAFEIAGIDLGSPHQRVIYYDKGKNNGGHPAIALGPAPLEDKN